ncbi:uncharacterized protein LOC135847723 [Planococcus citri]|uniref:uncharacterized protein LOC135847723 n=1 Tax=Planococcus citri TaxID=170843 RepID=UPI0031F7404A
MNNSWIEKILLNFFKNNADIFGEESTYHGFEREPQNHQLDGLQSEQLFGNIMYADQQGNIHKSIPLFIKLTADSPVLPSKFNSFSFANEINFYTKIAPTLETFDDSFLSLFPKFYHGEMMFNQKQNKSAIIFENVKTRGYKMSEKKSFLDCEHLTLMMRKLGEFHAYSYKAKNTAPDLFYPMVSIFQENNLFVNKETLHNELQILAARGFELLLQDPDYAQLASRIETMIENADDTFRKILTSDGDNPISVITHGDYLRNNLMFRYKNNIPDDLIMIDMATYRYASPVIDLAIVLYINTDQETRSKYWDKLIDEYYTALKGKFPENEIPSKCTIMSDFVGRSFYAYLVASFFLKSMFAHDNNIPLPQDFDPDTARKYNEGKYNEIPEEMQFKLCLSIGGKKCTQALKDILGDMIDRGFICS